MRMNIIRLLSICGLLWISLAANSQEKQLSRQEKKEIKKAQMNMNFNILDSLMNSKGFVLVADFLHNNYGERINVVPTLNFIKVNGSTGILQTGSNYSMGYNGVGGVTAEGTIGKWEVQKNMRNLTFTLHFNLMTNIGIYDVFMDVSVNNNATATITGLRPGKLTWEGHLETLNNSRVFKGQNTI